MSNLVPISTFVKELAAALSRKDGYIMGSRGQNPKTGYLDLKETHVKSSWKTTGWFYTQYSGSQKTKALYWREHATRVWDCNGLAEGIYELHTGTNINSKARYNYQQWCDPKGSGLIPAKYRVPGAAVFWGDSPSKIHHVGYLYEPVTKNKPEGDWYIIEARGVMYGVVKTKLNSRKPNYWGWMTKYFDYSNSSKAVTVTETTPINLKNGSTGSAVKSVQSQLIELGYDLGKWGADGDFGDATELAVRQFQKEHNLSVDGVVGEKTLAAIALALSNEANEKGDAIPQYVHIENGNCYIRTLPGAGQGSIRATAHKGDIYPYGGEINEETNYIKITYKDKDGWVSRKYGILK